MQLVIATLALFFLTAIFEIGGGYILWLWLREDRRLCLISIGYSCFWCCILLGGLTLFVYGILPTFQPANFGRVFAAYGGIFIVSSVIWGIIVDKKRPDRYEVIGSLIALLGALIIFYAPRYPLQIHL